MVSGAHGLGHYALCICIHALIPVADDVGSLYVEGTFCEQQTLMWALTGTGLCGLGENLDVGE